MKDGENRQRWKLALGGIGLCLLLAAVFTFGSLDVPFEPKNWRDVLTLYAVSSLITAALLVFGLVLIRTMVRVGMERRRDQLGARFKTKMLLGAMAISLLPVLFMFFVSYSLLNRTLARWFPRPLEIAAEQSSGLIQEMGHSEYQRLTSVASSFAKLEENKPFLIVASGTKALCGAADAYWQADDHGSITGF